MTAVLDPVDIDRDTNHTKMIHLTDPPYTHGLCGTKLTGSFRCDAEKVECVVCAELQRAGL